MINLNALFSDGTGDYRIPCEPAVDDIVTIRFRTAKDDAECVRLVSGGVAWDMAVIERDVLFDFYEVRLTLRAEPVFYYFEVISEGVTWFYNRWGAASDLKEEFHFQITLGKGSCVLPDFC